MGGWDSSARPYQVIRVTGQMSVSNQAARMQPQPLGDWRSLLAFYSFCEFSTTHCVACG